MRHSDSIQSAESSQARVSEVTISNAAVTDVHLRPLFTITICLPDAVSSVAVGAPTMFEAEHSDQEPRLVYVKPSTKEPTERNLVITMLSGGDDQPSTSVGQSTSLNTPVDFVIDYKPQQSFFIGSPEVMTKEEVREKARSQPSNPFDQCPRRLGEGGDAGVEARHGP